MQLKNAMAAAIVAAALTGGAYSEQAAAVDVDITFVIDRSGSMGGEFSFLGGAIGGFLNDLQGDSRIDSAQAALVSYLGSARLESGLTSDATALQSAFAGVPASGGTENALIAVDAAIPGGNANLGIAYRPGTVRSIVLITDEDADDENSYSNSFGTGPTALGALLDQQGFLNNVIFDQGGFDNPETSFNPIARPTGATFDITDFRDDRPGFFAEFTRVKIGEIVNQVPEPGVLGLMGVALLGMGATRRRRRG